jgi:hypothetical protein
MTRYQFGILITVEFKGDYMGMHMVGERFAEPQNLQHFLQKASVNIQLLLHPEEASGLSPPSSLTGSWRRRPPSTS